MADPKLSQIVEAYFKHLSLVKSLGGSTGEISLYAPLHDLLQAVGGTLKPKVFCVQNLADQGAGHPDFGLYAANQVQKGKPKSGQKPERGVIEVKPIGDDAWLTAESSQVSKYWEAYRQVLVTNFRDFVMVGEDAAGHPVKLETFRLADSADDFNQKLQKPRTFANEIGAGLGEYLKRALTHSASLTEPRDLAWLLASYARDGLARMEKAGDAQSLATLQEALEGSLGLKFEGEQGAAFFRSTLVQTLFYGVFSAWVLWGRKTPSPSERFEWRMSDWYLRTPVMQALFRQLAGRTQVQALRLEEVLDWAAAALGRVDRLAFFAKFSEGDAVSYFYEPFLQAFDPRLRKQLGVWYTPAEVVRYMVARVDKALKDDLGIADGLAGENVYVLDPCCGTGAYLAEVLRRIAANLEGRGAAALTGAGLKKAATERVFGFEIMPAPFVVAHLQVGLTMQDLGAPLVDDGKERAGVFLTNALTGWAVPAQSGLDIPELKAERELAERVKQDTPVLVILGNPPYNRYPGVGVSEEQELTLAYRETKHVKLVEKKALNDLYVRFFRMAERRIAEKTGQGVVCFISNYSWLDSLAFAGMRERYLEAFDAIRIDCLNGDRFKTGKTTPEGAPDPSIFSTPEDPVGIQVGTAISTLVRKADHKPAQGVDFRHLWGQTKRDELLATAGAKPDEIYVKVEPSLALGLPFADLAISDGWQDWPALPELFLTSFSGANTNRDPFLVDIDANKLKQRLNEYFDPALDHGEIANRYPLVMKPLTYFDAVATREQLVQRGGPSPEGFIRFTYRPFDTRWLYWEADTKLLNDKRADYLPHVFEENIWLSSARHLRKDATEPQACVTKHLSSLHLLERGAKMFPAWLRDDGLGLEGSGTQRRPNLSLTAQHYLDALGLDVEDLFHHVVATLHGPEYRVANAGALRMDWPRIPLPGWPDGKADGAADALAASAAQGRRLAALLDSETPVAGVTTGTLQLGLTSIAVPTTVDGGYMAGGDFAVAAGWGHFGAGDKVMPGVGKVVERDYTGEEWAALGDDAPVLGNVTFDVYLNERAYWRNVPAAVWDYQLGGYQVLKKWLSYRESKVLDRALWSEEVQHFTDTARRIAAIIQLLHG